MRLSEARLQAVSSKNIYSEHGIEARIGPAEGQGCKSIIVGGEGRPGEAGGQAARPIFSQSSRAFMTLCGLPSRRFVRVHSPSFSTARKNSSVTRTELFEFWPETVR